MATLVRFWNDQSLPALLMTGVRLHKVRYIFFCNDGTKSLGFTESLIPAFAL